MRSQQAPTARPGAMRFRLFIREGWTYAQASGDGRHAITTTVDRQAATAWPEAKAKRIGSRLVRRGLTVDLQPVDPGEAAGQPNHEGRA